MKKPARVRFSEFRIRDLFAGSGEAVYINVGFLRRLLFCVIAILEVPLAAAAYYGINPVEPHDAIIKWLAIAMLAVLVWFFAKCAAYFLYARAVSRQARKQRRKEI